MRLRETIELPDDAARELEALDAALAGRPVDDDLAELAELAVELRDERPLPADGFARDLDARARAGFRSERAATPLARVRAAWSGRMWVPALGAAASVAVATVLALSVIGDRGDPANEIVSGASVTATTPGSTGSTAAGQSATQDAQRPAGEDAATAPLPGSDDGRTATTLDDSAPGVESRAPTQLAPPGGGSGAKPSEAELRELARESVPLAAAPALPATPPVPSPSSDGAKRSVERGANLRLATTPRRLDDVSGRVVRVTDSVGGFVRGSAVDSRPGVGGGATFELQIPVTRLQTALARLSQIAAVRSRTESSLDVTEQVTFARNRVVALRAERRALLRQLEAAPSFDETARLRERLRSIEARLAQAKTQRAQLRQRTAYSPVSVEIVTERPRGGDSATGPWTPDDALDDAGRVLQIAAGVAVIALAVLLPLGLLAALAWPFARVARRRWREQGLDGSGGASPAA